MGVFVKCSHSSSDSNDSLLFQCPKLSTNRRVVALRVKLHSMAMVWDNELGTMPGNSDLFEQRLQSWKVLWERSPLSSWRVC